MEWSISITNLIPPSFFLSHLLRHKARSPVVTPASLFLHPQHLLDLFISEWIYRLFLFSLVLSVQDILDAFSSSIAYLSYSNNLYKTCVCYYAENKHIQDMHKSSLCIFCTWGKWELYHMANRREVKNTFIETSLFIITNNIGSIIPHLQVKLAKHTLKLFLSIHSARQLYEQTLQSFFLVFLVKCMENCWLSFILRHIVDFSICR